MYDYFHVKIAANILREGGVYGIQMQPYEAHIDQYMHFFGDYCLGGNEYIKISDFKIRHMPYIKNYHIFSSKATLFPAIFNRIID